MSGIDIPSLNSIILVYLVGNKKVMEGFKNVQTVCLKYLYENEAHLFTRPTFNEWD